MSTQSYIPLDTGSTINVATYIFSEGSTTVHINRSVLSDATGTDFATATNCLYAILSGGSTTITNTVTITGSTSIVNTPTITGSVSVINTPTITGSTTVVSVSTVVSITGSTTLVGTSSITGSTSVVNIVTITGSTTLVGTSSVTGSTSIVTAPSFSVATINPSTAGTSIIIPSTASNSIYVTSLVISNGLTAGTIYLGQGTGVVAPTTTAILINTLYFAANGGCVYPIPVTTPIKLTASNNFLCTVNSSGAISITATYYVAP